MVVIGYYICFIYDYYVVCIVVEWDVYMCIVVYYGFVDGGWIGWVVFVVDVEVVWWNVNGYYFGVYFLEGFWCCFVCCVIGVVYNDF